MSAVAENLFPSGFESGAAMSGLPWLDRRRADAWEKFRSAGIPHRRLEEWKYSDLRNALETPRAPASLPGIAADPFATINPVQLLIRDGQLAPSASGKTGC